MSTASEALPEALPASTRSGRSKNTTLFLLSMALIAGLAELALSIVNVSTLPVFLTNALKLPDLVGWSVGVFYLSEAIFNSPMGTLADRIGRRRLMVFGTMLSILTCIGTSFLRAPHHGPALDKWAVIAAVLGMRAVDGLGAAMLWPAIFAAIGDRIDASRQAYAMGVLNTMYMVGLAFGPKVGGYLNETVSGRVQLYSPLHYVPSFLSAAVCFALAGGAAYLVAPRRSEQHSALPAADSPTGEAAFSLTALKNALSKVPVLMVVAFVTFLGIGLIAPNIKLFAMARFHMTEDAFGTKLLIPALLVAAVAIPLGRAGDRWGKTRAIRLGMGICAMSMWTILWIGNEWAVVVVGSMLGVGFVLAFPAYMALLSDLTGPEERGGVIGAVRMAQGIGAMVGTPIGSEMYVHIRHEAPFLASAVFLTIAFLGGLFFIHEGPKRAKDSPST